MWHGKGLDGSGTGGRCRQASRRCVSEACGELVVRWVLRCALVRFALARLSAAKWLRSHVCLRPIATRALVAHANWTPERLAPCRCRPRPHDAAGGPHAEGGLLHPPTRVGQSVDAGRESLRGQQRWQRRWRGAGPRGVAPTRWPPDRSGERGSLPSSPLRVWPRESQELEFIFDFGEHLGRWAKLFTGLHVRRRVSAHVLTGSFVESPLPEARPCKSNPLGQTQAEVGRMLASLCQMWSKLGQGWAGQSWSDSGKLWSIPGQRGPKHAGFGYHLAGFWQHLAGSGPQPWSNSGQIWPMFHDVNCLGDTGLRAGADDSTLMPCLVQEPIPDKQA